MDEERAQDVPRHLHKRWRVDQALHVPAAARRRAEHPPDGPKTTNYDLSIAAQGKSHGTTTTAGSHDALSFSAVCREQSAEAVTVTVKRRSGSGPFTVSARYAG